MTAERNYQFRERLNTVHLPDRRDPDRKPGADQTLIDDAWRIVVAPDASDVVLQAARDFQDYLFVSMRVSLPLIRRRPTEALGDAAPGLVLGTCRELPAAVAPPDGSRGYRIQTGATRILLCGADDPGVAQGCYYLEDLMNLAEAPLLTVGETIRRPLFAPRMVHSGWGMDRFPDPHLNAMAHAGLDAVLVYAKGVDQTSHGHLDFNDLVKRAGRYGIDVYFYSTLKSLKHPEEPDAADFYDRTYGALFKACPGARGIILVGESCEFPSKDPHTTQRLRLQPAPDGLPDTKPSPGWWPCFDFPDWLNVVKTAIRRYRADADIVFWTYNWGWAPEPDRLALIQALPTDITLQATFEMHERIPRDGITHRTCDYTISFAGPGRYFASEAAEAARRGLRLYTMANTAGQTWDFGVTPYVPVPQQWARRHAALRRANRDWGLNGLMESHHFGFFPSCISELAKWAFWEPVQDAGTLIDRMAQRDFGPAGAPHARKAWETWSEAFRDHYPCTNEDQYGPFRVGPAYPLVFHPNLSMTFASNNAQLPEAPFAYYGSRIVFTDYKPFDHTGQTAGMRRTEREQAMLKRLLDRWEQGLDAMTLAVEATPARKRAAAERMLALGRFIRHTLITVLHVKQWYRLNMALLNTTETDAMHRILDELETVGRHEIANAEATLPVVQADSRLGWEPSMEYMCDADHLQWKIRQVKRVIDEDLPRYRQTVEA